MASHNIYKIMYSIIPKYTKKKEIIKVKTETKVEHSRRGRGEDISDTALPSPLALSLTPINITR